MEYIWEGRLATGTDYKVIDPPTDLKTEILGAHNDNGYIILSSCSMFSVLLFVGGVQVARLPAMGN